jgi:hypothetical protein
MNIAMVIDGGLVLLGWTGQNDRLSVRDMFLPRDLSVIIVFNTLVITHSKPLVMGFVREIWA